jgi:hypothetical protein
MNGFWPLQLLFENLEVHRDSNSQSESSFKSVEVHSLTLSHTPRIMKYDSRASLLGIATMKLIWNYINMVGVFLWCPTKKQHWKVQTQWEKPQNDATLQNFIDKHIIDVENVQKD